MHDAGEEVSSEEEFGATVKSSWNLKTSATKSARSKKCLLKQTDTSTPKRLRFDDCNDDSYKHNVNLNLQQTFDCVKQVNSNILAIQKHQQQIMINLDRHEKFLKI